MNRRHLIAVGIGAACIGVVLGLTAVMPESVTETQLEQVEAGMTADKVEAIFGMPATHDLGVQDVNPNHNRVVMRLWRNDDGSAAIIRFEDVVGTLYVQDKRWQDSTETIGEKLSRWIHWPWW